MYALFYFMLLLEYWLPVVGYEKYYEISYGGIMRNVTTKVCKKYHVDKHGYLNVNVPPKGCERVHRLVAATFVSNNFNKPEVNHIDGNKLNACAYNLEWVTRKENMEHAFLIGLKKSAIRPTPEQQKFIDENVYSLGVTEVSKRTGIHHSFITKMVGSTGLKHRKIIIDLNTGIFYNSDELAFVLSTKTKEVTRVIAEERKPNTTQYRYC